MASDMRRAVAALAAEKPEWIPVLEAAIAVSDRVDKHGGEICGAWVIDELESRSRRKMWLPNLRVLQSYGLVEKVGDSVRGGRRAYYRIPEKRALAEALSRLEPEPGSKQPPQDRRRFLFIASGDSGEPGSDWARRSADLPFEPASWRSS